MLYTRHTIFLSIFIFHISLSNDPVDDSNAQHVHFNIKPLYRPEVPEEIRQKINSEIAEQQNISASLRKDEFFTEEDIKEMELAFETSPQEAQSIVNYLQDPNYFPGIKNYKSIFFVGEPGTGKSITAKAIAYKMMQKGWEHKIISSTSLLEGYRNQTSIRLEKELKKIEASNKPTVLVIDELNQLLENSNSKHHDTDAISKVLWMFLDRHKNNKKICLIGTMNRINKIPQQIKSRIYFIEFNLMTDPKIKNNIIRKNLTTQNSLINAEVTDDFLDKELETINPYSWRELEKVSDEILIKSKLNNTKSSVVNISKDSITQGINIYLRKKAKEQYDSEEETDEERQNRYHKENLEMHERHFIQQQALQFIMYKNTHNISKEVYESILYSLTEEQKEIYNEIFEESSIKETAREKKAAAEKAKKDAENSWSNWFGLGKKSS